MTVTTWKTPASNNNSPYIPEKTVLPESNTLCGEKHAYSAMAMETYCITARSRDEQRRAAHAGKIDSKKTKSPAARSRDERRSAAHAAGNK